MSTGNARVELLDFVRGVAIIGTMVVNYSIFSETAVVNFDEQDLAILAANLFAKGKFLSLLAIVFGVGLAIQYDRAERAGRLWLAPYLWRNLLLVGDGLLHFTLVFHYDILMAYGLAAMVTALLVSRNDKAVRRWSFVALGAHVVIQGAMFLALSRMDKAESRALDVSHFEWLNSFSLAPYGDQIVNRWQNFETLRFETFLVQPTFVYLMLLGTRLWREGFFRTTVDARVAHKKLAIWGLGAGLPTLAVWFLPYVGVEGWGRYFFSPLLAVGYLGLLALLYDANANSPATRFFTDIGRMAMSCYVLQNVACSLLFYAWGFGLRGKLEPGLDVFVFFCLVGIQGVFATSGFNGIRLGL